MESFLMLDMFRLAGLGSIHVSTAPSSWKKTARFTGESLNKHGSDWFHVNKYPSCEAMEVIFHYTQS